MAFHPGNSLVAHDLVRKPVPTFRDHALGLCFKPQATERLERIGVEGTELDDAANLDRHHDVVAADGGREHLGARRQRLRDIRKGCGAFLDMKKAVADDEEHETDSDEGGRHDDDHHPANLRYRRGSFRVKGLLVVGHHLSHG